LTGYVTLVATVLAAGALTLGAGAMLRRYADWRRGAWSSE